MTTKGHAGQSAPVGAVWNKACQTLKQELGDAAFYAGRTAFPRFKG